MDVRVSSKERTARGLMLLPERFALEKREMRDVERVPGTGAMVFGGHQVYSMCRYWNGMLRLSRRQKPLGSAYSTRVVLEL